MTFGARIESNLDDIIRDFQRALKRGGRYAHENRDEIEEIMTDRIAFHFNRLSMGGVDPTALGGTVKWKDYRAKETEEERERDPQTSGVFPLLQKSGDMKDEHTTSPLVRSSAAGLSSRVSLMGGTQEAREKAVKHETGGQHLAVFPVINQFRQMQFPKRPFLYWDVKGADDVEQRVGDKIEQVFAGGF